MRILLSLLTLLARLDSPAIASDTFDKDELALIAVLVQGGYIRHADCATIASALLSRNGLPALGKTGAVEGERLDFDRRGELTATPRFQDGIRKAGKEVSIAAGSEASSWKLSLRRKIMEKSGSSELETHWAFHPGSRVNAPSCELDSINAAWTVIARGKTSTGSTRFDAHDCLALYALFDADAIPNWTPDPAVSAWIWEDCRMGLSYFTSFKEVLLSKSATKKPK